MQLDANLARQSRIEGYDVLDRHPSADLQAIVDLTAQVCGVPFAAINLITETQQHQVAAAGFASSVCSRRDSMCASVLEEPSMAVSDASQDERFAANPFVTGEIGAVRFYASAPLVTPDGVTIGRLCVFDDAPRTVDPTAQAAVAGLAQHVTDLLELRLRTRQLESSLHELTRIRDELRRSNDELDAFASQVAHDLRTPLTVILANAEQLAVEPAVVSDPDLEPLASGVVGASVRLATMIDDMLAYARVTGRLRLADTDLEVLVANVLHDLGQILRERGATVQVGSLPIVHADAGQLYIVLLNLVDNAVKYAGNRSPDISIGYQAEPHCHRISVRDNGVGIAPERLGDVFEPFVRGHEPGEIAVEGSGIGLDTVKRIVQSHGGSVGLESTLGVGSTVWFELPLPA
ncbi:MAG: GAF domain-containing sensor histidine kinase [Nocardioides sp.]